VRTMRRQPWLVMLLLVGTALGGVDCSKQLPCRPGTVFVSVDLGGYTTATDLDVDVSVEELRSAYGRVGSGWRGRI